MTQCSGARKATRRPVDVISLALSVGDDRNLQFLTNVGDAGACDGRKPGLQLEQVEASRGFQVYNLSSHPIRLVNVTGDGNFEGRPPDGAIATSGVGYHDFAVTFEFFSTQSDTANYDILGDGGSMIGDFRAMMKVYGGDALTESNSNTTVGTSTPNQAATNRQR